MIKELIKLASELDKRGLKKEADVLDRLVKEAVGGNTGRAIDILTGKTDPATRKSLWPVFKKKKTPESEDKTEPSVEEPKEKPSMMDVAIEQEADKKNKEIFSRLKETEGWFSDNIFLSKADKLPVTMDKEYLYSNSGATVPKGTVFKSLEEDGVKSDGSHFPHSLKEIYKEVQWSIKSGQNLNP